MKEECCSFVISWRQNTFQTFQVPETIFLYFLPCLYFVFNPVNIFMNRWILVMILFFLTLFFYIHLNYQFKTSSNIDILIIDTALTKSLIDNACHVRQPFLIPRESQQHVQQQQQQQQQTKQNWSTSLMLPAVRNKFTHAAISSQNGAFDVLVRNTQDSEEEILRGETLYLPIKWKNAVKLFAKDDSHSYIAERNSPFLEETGLDILLTNTDSVLACPCLWNGGCEYDLLTGSAGAATVLQYGMAERTFLYVASTKSGTTPIRVMLAPPMHTKYLSPVTDYLNFEFRSATLKDPWVGMGTVSEEVKEELAKVKFTEVVLKEEEAFFVPPYWWYSLRFGDAESIVLKLTYRSVMNMGVMIPHYVRYYLQQQNVRQKYVPVMEKLPEKDDVEEEGKDKAPGGVVEEGMEGVVEDKGKDTPPTPPSPPTDDILQADTIL